MSKWVFFKVAFHVDSMSRTSQTLLEWSFLFEVGDRVWFTTLSFIRLKTLDLCWMRRIWVWWIRCDAFGWKSATKWKLYIYFDNFFTGIPLLAELKNKGFCALGVLKSNRMEGAALMPKSEMKKGGTGTMDTLVSKDKNICIVRWQDNNMVNHSLYFRWNWWQG